MQARTWRRWAVGLVVIGGTFAVLWALYGPSLDGSEPAEKPLPLRIQNARAVVSFFAAGSARAERADITCLGPARSASGFWARDPAEACDALASTRAALLAGPGCPRDRRARERLHVVGRIGSRHVDHRAERLGCPDPEHWLDVNALVAPVLPPEREATEAPRP